MNKYIQFFPIMLVLALVACTDYSEQINDSFEESRESIRSSICADLWCGIDHSTTFNGDGEWYWYTDVDAGGQSRLYFSSTFASDVERFSYIDAGCTLGGKFTHNQTGKENMDPYASVVAGFKKTIDISSWKGVCVVYASNSDIRLMLDFDGENAFDYDRPMYWLEETDGDLNHYVTIDIGWESFKTTGWFKGTPVETAYALSVATGLEFQFTGPRSNDVGQFRIYTIGRYGTCK